jgi:hypothetical protein
MPLIRIAGGSERHPLWGQAKPAQYDLLEAQAAMRDNAERLGIDSSKITLLSPLWEKAGNLFDLTGLTGVPTTNTAWTTNGIKNTAAGGGVGFAGGSDKIAGATELTVLQTVVANSQGIGTLYGHSCSSDNYTQANLGFGNTSGRFYCYFSGTGVGGSFNYTSELYGQPVNIVGRWKDGETNGTQLWVNGVNTDSGTAAVELVGPGVFYVGNRTAYAGS